MDIEKIKMIVEMMSEHDLTEFKIESKDSNLCIKRASAQNSVPVPQIITQQQVPSVVTTPAQVPAPQAVSAQPETPKSASPSENTINAPIVGTFYRAPSPEAPPFVKEGDRVNPETVVCIIEAMKVMNEIKAEKSGIIKQVLVENAKPVEYGQPLFVLE